jgi:hypothetical protein
MKTLRHIFRTSGASFTRSSMLTSLGLHVLGMGLLMLVPAQVLLRSAPPENKELDIVFYRPPEVAVPARAWATGSSTRS